MREEFSPYLEEAAFRLGIKGRDPLLRRWKTAVASELPVKRLDDLMKRLSGLRSAEVKRLFGRQRQLLEKTRLSLKEWKDFHRRGVKMHELLSRETGNPLHDYLMQAHFLGLERMKSYERFLGDYLSSPQTDEKEVARQYADLFQKNAAKLNHDLREAISSEWWLSFRAFPLEGVIKNLREDAKP